MFLPALLVSGAQVDLRFEAAPVARVVAALAQKSGTDLSVDPAVGGEIMAVSLSGIAPGEAMGRLARALDAEWSTLGGRPTLRRNLDTVGGERRPFAQAMRKGYQRAFDAFAPVPTFSAEAYVAAMTTVRESDEAESNRHRGTDPDRNGEAARVLREESPLARLSKRVVAGLTPAFVEGLGQGRVVFGTRPNSVQRGATAAQERAFAEYLREEAAVARLTGSNDKPNGWATNPAAALETIVDRWPNWVRVRIRVLDSQGAAIVGTFGETLEPDLDPRNSLRSIAGERRIAPIPGELPTEGKAPDGARDRLLDVRNHDPLTKVGAWLIRCAEARHEGLVAVMGDDLLDALPYSAIEPGKYLVGLADRGYTAREVGGTLWIAPLDRVGTRAHQMDRNALAWWLDIERAGRRLTVADYTRMMRRFPLVRDSNEMIHWLEEAGVPDATWNTPFLREALRLPHGRTMRLEDLPPDLRESLVSRILEAGPGDYRVRIVGPVCGTGWDVAPDGTDELPLGVPRDATVRIDDSREACLVPTTSGRVPFQVWDPVTASDLNHDPSWYDLPVRLGTVRRIDLTVDMGKFGQFQERVEAVEELGRFVDARTAPEPLGAAVRHAIAETDRRYPSKG